MISCSQIRAAPGWPDIIAAVIMAALAAQSAVTIVRQSLSELRISQTTPAPV
jgi:hypothetical protein